RAPPRAPRFPYTMLFRSPGELARWIETTGITIWYSVPSALTRMLLHGDLGRFRFPRLRAVLFAGEVFPVGHLRPVMEAFSAAGLDRKSTRLNSSHVKISY